MKVSYNQHPEPRRPDLNMAQHVGINVVAQQRDHPTLLAIKVSRLQSRPAARPLATSIPTSLNGDTNILVLLRNRSVELMGSYIWASHPSLAHLTTFVESFRSIGEMKHSPGSTQVWEG